MIHPVRSPLAALLAAALFLVAGAERAFSYAACPHHGMAAPAGRAGHATHDHDAPPSGDHSGPCSCLGACQTAGAGVLPSARSLQVAAPGAVTRAAGPTVEIVALPGREPHTLPFATAPPAPLADH